MAEKERKFTRDLSIDVVLDHEHLLVTVGQPHSYSAFKSQMLRVSLDGGLLFHLEVEPSSPSQLVAFFQIERKLPVDNLRMKTVANFHSFWLGTWTITANLQ